jgi:hypothetical protein
MNLYRDYPDIASQTKAVLGLRDDQILDYTAGVPLRLNPDLLRHQSQMKQINAIPAPVLDEIRRWYAEPYRRNGGDPELSIPLRKDLNPDRIKPTCPGCYYYSPGVGLKCAVNPTGTADTCEHFKPK